MTDTTTTLYIRGVSRSTALTMKHAAAIRRETLGTYLGRLVILHESLRNLVDEPDESFTIQKLLTDLGLATVRG